MQRKEAIIAREYISSKHYKIFDLTGKISPIAATMKLDLLALVKRGLDWNDVLSNELRPIWVSHFEMMQEIGKIIFQICNGSR